MIGIYENLQKYLDIRDYDQAEWAASDMLRAVEQEYSSATTDLIGEIRIIVDMPDVKFRAPDLHRHLQDISSYGVEILDVSETNEEM